MSVTKARFLSRFKYIDYCKGIGILLVILGHTYGIPQGMYNIIYSFHMPLFFIIFGFLFDGEKYRTTSLLSYTVKRFTDYIIPYLVFGVINLFLQILWRTVIFRESVTLNDIIHNISPIL